MSDSKQLLKILMLPALAMGGIFYGLLHLGTKSLDQRHESALPKASDAQIRDALLPHRKAFEATRRAVYEIQLEALQDDAMLASKLGGAPYLGHDESMPLTRDGGAMVLLAQINFADIPDAKLSTAVHEADLFYQAIPRRGLLQIFIALESNEHQIYGMQLGADGDEDLTQQDYFKLRYIANPSSNPEDWQVLNPAANNSTPHRPNKPRRMRFVANTETITPVDVNFPEAIGFSPYEWAQEKATQMKVDLSDFADRALPSPGGNKLGGYPMFSQSDPRRSGNAQRLLLQLDSDAELMWGDGGMGSFFIDPEHLLRRDFSKVLYSWDSH